MNTTPAPVADSHEEMAQPDSPEGAFVALRDGLIEFRARVEGEPRKRVLRVAGRRSDQLVPGIVVKILEALAAALRWLREVIRGLMYIDVIVAMTELVADAAQAFSGMFAKAAELPADAPIELGPALAPLEGGVSAVAGVLDDIGELAERFAPDPEVLSSIDIQLEALVGETGVLSSLVDALRPPTLSASPSNTRTQP